LPALRLAHRGDWRRAPENTIAAFLAALDVPGCDGLEFDVRSAKDGVPVVIHDETLDRVQRAAGRVADLGPDELAAHGVPTLEEVLAVIPRRAFLDVELKGDPGRGAVDVLTAGRGPGLERAVVSSFAPETLERVGRLAPSWPRWLNTHYLEPATIAIAVGLEYRRRRGGLSMRVSAPGVADAAWSLPPSPSAAARHTPWSDWGRRDLRRGPGARRLTDHPISARAAERDGRERRHEPTGSSSFDDDARPPTWSSSARARSAAGPRTSRSPTARAASWSWSAVSPAWAPVRVPRASSGPRAGRPRPSRSADGRSTSTAARPRRSARIPGSASSAT
jgi:hypothetical protein